MSENEYTTRVGSIAGIIFLLINLFSILCEVLNIDSLAFVSFSELVDDSSGFQTMICISFILYTILIGRQSTRLISISVVDIVLANKLYSNAKWKMIITYFKVVNKNTLVLVMLAGILVIYIAYKIIIKTRKKNHEEINDNLNQERGVYQTKNNNGKDNGENTTNKFVKEEQKGVYIKMFCVFVIVLGLLDYIVYNLIPIKINRPKELEWTPDVLYYCSLICATVLFVIICVPKFFCEKKNTVEDIDSDNKSSLGSNLPGICAVLSEIIIIIFHDNPFIQDLPGKFLKPYTENWLVSFFLLIVYYMVLDIIFSVFFNLFPNANSKNEFTEIFKDTIEKVEEKMVLVACNIFDGCISLLDFIPDFFTTIGLLLFDKKIKLIMDEKKEEANGGKEDEK